MKFLCVNCRCKNQKKKYKNRKDSKKNVDHIFNVHIFHEKSSLLN